MAHHDFDLLIAGAGPAGCTLALNLAPTGIRIGIIEKDIFPRHKICGDALSGKVMSVMKRLPGNIYQEFLDNVDKIPSWGIRFIAPNHHVVDIPFTIHKTQNQPAPGFVCKRDDFDNFMFERLGRYSNIEVFQGLRLDHVTVSSDFIIAKTQKHEFHAKVIAGADGVNSSVRKSFQTGQVDKRHFCVGIRGYFENVSGLHPENYIELIFLKDLIPGYFWIFPSTGGLVNAGFGMLQDRISKQGENLSRILDDLLRNHPLIAPRFKESRLVGRAEAHTLPLGTYPCTRSGNRFVLLGDAAFLVDPFSGEGIGNAMASGEIAAAILKPAFDRNDFSAGTLSAYDQRVDRRFSQEFRTMGIMQRLAGSARLFNLVVDKARKHEDVRELLSAMFMNADVKKRLTRPGFYARLLFR